MRIFICYRRDDSGGYAGRLYERLSGKFGRDQVFMDIDAIPAGQDFIKAVEERVASCNALIALIGKTWLKVTDDAGRRRLENSDDFVRLEIAAALQQNKRVIPVLVGGAQMPKLQDLPAPLAQLAYRNAFEIYDRLFDESTDRLIAILRPPVIDWRVFRRLNTRWLQRVSKLLIAGVGIALLVILIVRSSRPLKERAAEPPAMSRQSPAPQAGNSRAPSIAPFGASVIVNETGTSVEVRAPTRVKELPPLVENARDGFTFLNSGRAAGPTNPKVIWQAPLYGDFIGVAGDGTVYLWDSHHLVGVREGVAQWAYNFEDSFLEPLGIASDGRVWIEGYGEAIDHPHRYCFNSRGEGGLVSDKQPEPPNILRGKDPIGRFDRICDVGTVSGYRSQGGQRWSVQLDGNCHANVEGSYTKSEQGDIVVATDAGTLYSITDKGRVSWSYKAGCAAFPVYSKPPDDIVFGCGPSLYSLRVGKARWSFSMPGATQQGWGRMLFDKSGTVYVGHTEDSSHTLIAVNEQGQLIWKIPFRHEVAPLALDKHGRLYVKEGTDRIYCISD